MIEVPPPTRISTPRTPSRSLREERHVVDPRDRVVLVGRRERGLDLARHRLRRRVADEVAHVRAGVRGDVEQLALERAGARVAGDVAHRVAAALAARQAGVAELADQLGRVRQRHVVHLDVLARRDVALAQRHVLLDHVGERVELVGRDAADRQLDPDHLHVGLALAVDALLEAELDELVVLELALQEARRLGVEVVELALEDRDHVPRNVLEHLGVLERSGPAVTVMGGRLGGVGTRAWRRCGVHRTPSGRGRTSEMYQKAIGVQAFWPIRWGIPPSRGVARCVARCDGAARAASAASGARPSCQRGHGVRPGSDVAERGAAECPPKRPIAATNERPKRIPAPRRWGQPPRQPVRSQPAPTE